MTNTAANKMNEIFEKLSDKTSFDVVFNEANVNWTNQKEYNQLFLMAQENYINDRLKAQGYLFLNDVYDVLGFPRTPAGQLVGWLFNSNQYDYVDFLTTDRQSENPPAIRISFNVSGIIYDKI